jgi:thiol:disulfide interchange protein DsbA
MKRTILAILAIFSAHAALAQTAGEFVAGTHYNRLTPTQPTSSGPQQVEVAEVFWYGCPHCFNFDPYLNSWEQSNADYINFVRIPAVWNPLVRFHAQAFYTAQVLDKGEAMHLSFFQEIHQNQNYLDSPEKLATFFANFGVSRNEFETAFNSREVNERLQRAEELSGRYQIDSVPTVIINGKYTSNASMTGSYDRLIELIDVLAASERATE